MRWAPRGEGSQRSPDVLPAGGLRAAPRSSGRAALPSCARRSARDRPVPPLRACPGTTIAGGSPHRQLRAEGAVETPVIRKDENVQWALPGQPHHLRVPIQVHQEAAIGVHLVSGQADPEQPAPPRPGDQMPTVAIAVAAGKAAFPLVGIEGPQRHAVRTPDFRGIERAERCPEGLADRRRHHVEEPIHHPPKPPVPEDTPACVTRRRRVNQGRAHDAGDEHDTRSRRCRASDVGEGEAAHVDARPLPGRPAARTSAQQLARSSLYRLRTRLRAAMSGHQAFRPSQGQAIDVSPEISCKFHASAVRCRSTRWRAGQERGPTSRDTQTYGDRSRRPR